MARAPIAISKFEYQAARYFVARITAPIAADDILDGAGGFGRTLVASRKQG